MGNDVSSKAARTLIPLDDSLCWQLYNGVNERGEPISFFVSKQTFSVECRRSIQFLKTIRHPNIIKFLNGFKTFVDHDSFIADCVHPLTDKLTNDDIDLTAKLSLGLYQLTQAFEFLHEKASISHNNLCLLSLYISLNGTWKLGNFECACRYDQLNKKYLSSLKLIRAEECITPEEDQSNNSKEFERQDIPAIDIYAFGMLIRRLMDSVSVDDSVKSVLNDLQENLTDEDPQSRPTWSKLLQTQLFQIDYIKATELLDRLPTVHEPDLPNAVESLSTYLDNLGAEYFNELLIRRLFVPFMFLCSSTRSKLIPRIIIPKDDDHPNSWISIDKYRTCVVPVLVDLYSYHVTCIRETLLEYFNSYWQLIEKTTLTDVILPQLIYGLKDQNNNICTLTLLALAAMVPVLGADVVVGGQRKQIFTDTIKRDNVAFPKTAKIVSTTNSPLPTPPPAQKLRKPSPLTRDKHKTTRAKPSASTEAKTTTTTTTTLGNQKPLPPPPPPPPSLTPLVPPSSSQYTNGHHSSTDNSTIEAPTTIVENGRSDHDLEDEIDNDDDQWSDWEQDPVPTESSNEISPLSTTIQEQVLSKPPVTSSNKSLKLNNTAKSKWNPNAPLGSEYEIPPVVLNRQKSVTTGTTKSQDVDDFFKDMAPKVQTVELMQQLENMFSANADQPNEQKKSTMTTRTTKTPVSTSSSSFSNKFGVVASDHDDNQELDVGNNNWDE